MGGLAGAVLGIVASKVLSALAQWPTLISPAAVAGGFAFAAAVGVFFGWYPARKASLLDPIEALKRQSRYLDANRRTCSCHLSPNTRIITC